MNKKKTPRIDRDRAIMLLKEISTEVYPCSKYDEYNFYEYSDSCISYYLKNNSTDVGFYITDDYECGLLELIQFIENNKLDNPFYIEKTAAYIIVDGCAISVMLGQKCIFVQW